MYRHFFKRLLDIVLCMLALLVLSPLMLVISVLVRIFLGSPIIFSQTRPGKHGKLFTLKKFRTMTDKKDASGEPLPDSQRLTKFGRILRTLSIDELPELINIIKGDMSIVGPRPLLCDYLPYYTEAESHRHDVLPGLTGLAQINGRNAAGWEERLGYDLEYVNKLSFWLDVKIVFLTIYKVISREGVRMGEERTVEKLNVIRQNEQNEQQSISS